MEEKSRVSSRGGVAGARGGGVREAASAPRLYIAAVWERDN